MRLAGFAVAILLAGTAASAATYDVTVGGSGGSGGAPFSFSGFDASLGTLTEVDFDLSSSTSFSVTSPPPSGPDAPAPPSGTATYNLKSGYFLYIGGIGTQPYVAQTGIGSATLTYGAFDASVAGTGLTSIAVSTAALRDAFGTPTLTGNAFADPPFMSSVQFNGDPAGGLTYAVSSSNFSGTVTYTYTPLRGAVPEPATWATMVAGFGIAGGALRRRRGGTARA